MSCTVANCNKVIVAKGLCNAHYMRAKRGANLTDPIKVTKGAPLYCSKEGCNKKHYGLTFCKAHYTADLRRQRWLQIIELKGGCCARCKNSYHYSVYDLHHLDPSQKELGIGAEITNVSLDKILKEVEKCILLCANCHRLTHSENG